MRYATTLALVLAWTAVGRATEAAATGTVEFEPKNDQNDIPTRYKLEPHKFDFELKRIKDLPVSGIEIHELRFPSPVQTKYRENNTVYCEYYVPKGIGPFPAVIVLDITNGDQKLSRIIARHLARNKIAGLFVQMAYYGPRRPKEGNVRLLSTDVAHTVSAVTQTVLDLRRAAAWLESRPEIDKSRLGIMGTSLGSFIAALASQMEPRLGRCAVLLGGGGFVDAFYDHPQAKPYRKVYEALGGTKKLLTQLLAPVDPLTRADLLKDRKLLIVAAKRDEVVPPRMAENLWKASGQQRIIWLDAGHLTAAIYLLPGLNELVEHFR